jgi:hypothetical protein
MRNRILRRIFLALLFSAVHGVNASESEVTEINHENPTNGLWSLDFDAEGYKQLSESKESIIARGRFEKEVVGFRIIYEPNWNFYKDTTTEPSGFVSLQSIGDESENLIRALYRIFDADPKGMKFKEMQRYPVVSSKGWRSDFRMGQIDFLVKGTNAKTPDYFEFELIVLKDKQTVWIKEIKKEYRLQILSALSKRKGLW